MLAAGRIDGDAINKSIADNDSNKVHLNLLDIAEPPPNQRSAVQAFVAAEAKEAAPPVPPPAEPTPADILKQQEQIYPELAFTRQAMEALADPSLDAKSKWDKANNSFHQAEIAIETYVDNQGGIPKMTQDATDLAKEVFAGIDQFKQGKRGITSADFPDKPKAEQLLRETIKNYSNEELIGALRGEKGIGLQRALSGVLKDDEKDALADVDVLLNKVQLVSSIRVRHALLANQFGISNSDSEAKILSEEILKGIAATDPDTYRRSPEIHGLILQAQSGKPMDLSEGKAIALAFTVEAEKTIVNTQTGPGVLRPNADIRAGAEQATRLLAAALASNAQVVKEAWASWPMSVRFQNLYDRAEKLAAPPPKPTSLPTP